MVPMVTESSRQTRMVTYAQFLAIGNKEKKKNTKLKKKQSVIKIIMRMIYQNVIII